jgi:hypothetical protein
MNGWAVESEKHHTKHGTLWFKFGDRLEVRQKNEYLPLFKNQLFEAPNWLRLFFTNSFLNLGGTSSLAFVAANH